VVAAEDITAILGEYLGEFEHVSAVLALRPRNEGFRLVMRQPPERPSHSIRIAINAESIGGLMRFVNHSCVPVAQFVEVANGRRTTVVVAATHDVLEGEEITPDYGEDLWFVCRCGHKNCCHRDIQDQRNP
jgi:SET domain-containing protein